MKVADLFNPHTRDQAVKVLGDEDLVLATLMQCNENPTCPLQREWLAGDVVWFATHCRDPLSIETIIRTSLTTISIDVVYEAFLKISHYQKPPRDIRKPARDVSGEVTHLLAARNGLHLLTALVRYEVAAAAAGVNLSPIAWEYLLRFCQDADLLEEGVSNLDITGSLYLAERLEELGEQHRLVGIAERVPHVKRLLK
jgi:hypothetical protein